MVAHSRNSSTARSTRRLTVRSVTPTHAAAPARTDGEVEAGVVISGRKAGSRAAVEGTPQNEGSEHATAAAQAERSTPVGRGPGQRSQPTSNTAAVKNGQVSTNRLSVRSQSVHARSLNAPRPVLVETHANDTPRRVNRRAVNTIREEWNVVDRWWTDAPIDRRYFEVVLETGENVVVYRDGESRDWLTQRV